MGDFMKNSIQEIANNLAQATANKQEMCVKKLANQDMPAFFTAPNGEVIRARVLVTFLDSKKSIKEN